MLFACAYFVCADKSNNSVFKRTRIIYGDLGLTVLVYKQSVCTFDVGFKRQRSHRSWCEWLIKVVYAHIIYIEMLLTVREYRRIGVNTVYAVKMTANRKVQYQVEVLIERGRVFVVCRIPFGLLAVKLIVNIPAYLAGFPFNSVGMPAFGGISLGEIIVSGEIGIVASI